MTESTTIINACDASVWLDDDADTLTDISGTTNNLTIALSRNVGATPVFGSRWPRRRMCGNDCQIDFTILYSTAIDEAMDILKTWIMGTDDDPRTVTIYVPDKNVGSDKFTGEFVLENLNIPLTAGEGKPIEVTGRLLVDGDFSTTTAST